MKSIKEKQLLVKWSQAMNEPIDAAIVEEVERYERIKQDILISVKQNTLNDLKEASLVANEVVEKVRDYPKPPTVDELMQVLKEEQHELVQAQTTEEPTIQEDTLSLADRAAEHITQKAKLEEKTESFQQPEPTLVEKNLNAIQKKLKFLEQALGKIAATGPGGGEVRLEYLDDVDRSTAKVDGKFLKYDAASGKWIGADGGTGGGASVSTGTEPPSSPTLGDLWWASDEGQMYIYYDDQWVQAAESVLAAEDIPTSLTDLGITDGTNGQVLTTNGAGTFTFKDPVAERVVYYGKADEDIAKGDVVMFGGAQGSHVLFLKNDMQSAGYVPEMLMGVAETSMLRGDFGNVIEFGKLSGFTTSQWQEGDFLYADPDTPGAFTTTEPSSPNHSILVAAVIYSQNNNGTILIRPTHKSEFDELHGVSITDKQVGDVLQWDGTNWVNGVNGSIDIVNDTSPQLGGNLDAQTYTISNVSKITANTVNTQLVRPDSGALLLASNIGGGTGAYISLSSSENGVSVFSANGTGTIVVSADLTQIGKAGDATLTTNAGDLILNTRSGTNSGVIRIYDQADGNILLDPNGTGIVDVQGDLTATGDVTGYAFNGRIGSVTGTSVNASFYPMFVSSIAPNQYLEGHSGLTYNPSTGTMSATKFSGGFGGTLYTDLNAQSFAKLINLPTPTNDGDAASKGYVDGKTEDLADKRLVYIRSGDTNVNSSVNTVLDWNSELVASTIPDFTHSSGVFTNTSTRTRRFLFQMQVAIRAQSTVFTEADLWFSYNGTYSSTNRRGQVNYTSSTSSVMLSTSWTFTLAQNETVRGYFWCNQASVYGNTQSPPGSSFGNQYSSLIEVQELN